MVSPQLPAISRVDETRRLREDAPEAPTIATKNEAVGVFQEAPRRRHCWIWTMEVVPATWTLRHVRCCMELCTSSRPQCTYALVGIR